MEIVYWISIQGCVTANRKQALDYAAILKLVSAACSCPTPGYTCPVFREISVIYNVYCMENPRRRIQ